MGSMPRTQGAKDKPTTKRRKATPEELERLSPNWKPSVGLPSQVIRTHGERRALNWWADLSAPERARWVNWLYANQDRIDLTPAEEWGD